MPQPCQDEWRWREGEGILASRVIPARTVADLPVVRLTVRLAREPGDGDVGLDEGADRGAQALARTRAGEEGRAGIQAFLERRRPPWVKP